MKERPILFGGEMVRAILDGSKTQTRRVIKPQPDEAWTMQGPCVINGHYADGPCKSDLRCPYGKSGDRLWVKETFMPLTKGFAYRADGLINEKFPGINWQPSIFMPRSASRIMLEIESIRVERVQDISEEDAIAEGCGYYDKPDDFPLLPLQDFCDLWDSINEKRGFGWKDNPWVWVIEFQAV